jgi:hypothetical protein
VTSTHWQVAGCRADLPSSFRRHAGRLVISLVLFAMRMPCSLLYEDALLFATRMLCLRCAAMPCYAMLCHAMPCYARAITSLSQASLRSSRISHLRTSNHTLGCLTNLPEHYQVNNTSTLSRKSFLRHTDDEWPLLMQVRATRFRDCTTHNLKPI